MWTSWPPTSSWTSEPVACTPVTVPCTVSPLAVEPVMCRPISAAAAASCDALFMAVICVSRSLIFCTMLNCAVCARYWLGSAGLSGFWYLSSATSSFRNVLGSVRLLLPVAAAGAGAAGLRGLIELMGTSQVDVDAAAGAGLDGGRERCRRRRLVGGRGRVAGQVRRAGTRAPGPHVERAELQPRVGQCRTQVAEVRGERVARQHRAGGHGDAHDALVDLQGDLDGPELFGVRAQRQRLGAVVGPARRSDERCHRFSGQRERGRRRGHGARRGGGGGGGEHG